jgi:hypothetical protein
MVALKIIRFLPFCLLLLAPSLFARVGEDRGTIEARFNRERAAIEIRDRQLFEFYSRRAPVLGWISAVQDRVDYVIYFKTIREVIANTGVLWNTDRNNRVPERNPEGWLHHVVYLQNQSVLEFFEKTGGITPFERDGLLSLHAGNSTWKRGNPREAELPPPSTLPVNAYREDGMFYANLAGNNLLIYRPELDELITETVRRVQSTEAPQSLRGF